MYSYDRQTILSKHIQTISQDSENNEAVCDTRLWFTCFISFYIPLHKVPGQRFILFYRKIYYSTHDTKTLLMSSTESITTEEKEHFLATFSSQAILCVR